ncbi:unnamed protein product [Ostreobium quekettii]|uniref:Uncharacterized protein n=1 Tax=Ostreobium quekettii TaxID=121088 RepID=A0A8S1J9T4_9CHLO|nr:unnamed protein product [Ostreobium quekettii]
MWLGAVGVEELGRASSTLWALTLPNGRRTVLIESPIGKLTADFLNLHPEEFALLPDFLNLTPQEVALLPPESLPPLFDDLYAPALPPKFGVGERIVDVTRRGPPILGPGGSTFKAHVLYPVGDDDRDDFGSHPLIGFAPGLAGTPMDYIRTLHFLASQGAVVIAPTQPVTLFSTSEEFRAFAADVAESVRWVLGDGSGGGGIDDDDGSYDDGFYSDDGYYGDDDFSDDGYGDDGGFRGTGNDAGLQLYLRRLVDRNRVGMFGHSVGGALILEAARVARDHFSIFVRDVFSTSPPCIDGSDLCDIPYHAAMALEGTRVKFYVAGQDTVTPPHQAELFLSLLPASAIGEFMVLEGGTHCFVESDPRTWPFFSSECGKGGISPFHQIAEWQRQLLWFFFGE